MRGTLQRMTKQQQRAITTVTAWRARHSVTIVSLEDAVGDTGGQLQRWLSGNRHTLPMPIKARLSECTGIPLEILATATEMRFARILSAVLARDAAA